jgi:hypothetical protein
MQLLLPPELKHRIVELSSHDTLALASLARTHTTYQILAEQALYLSLYEPSLKCLETLATNSEKAGFVRFLTTSMGNVYFRVEDDPQRAIGYLLNALVNMHSLSDLRLRIPWHFETESLDKILWSVYELGSFDLLKTNCWRHSNLHFRLQTLYCDTFLDLFQIIKSQTELQILGIYKDYGNEAGFLGTFKRLQSAQLHLPVIVELGVDFNGYFNKISVFPAFNSIDRRPSIYQVLAESFDKLGDRSPYMLSDISGLSIYLVDSCDMPSIHVLIKDMTTTFPDLTWLNFCFENPCKIVSFLLTMTVIELKSICVISASTGDKENYLFIPRSV